MKVVWVEGLMLRYLMGSGRVVASRLEENREQFAYRSSKCGWGSGCVDLWTGEDVGSRCFVN